MNLDTLVEFLFEAHWRTRRFHKAFSKLQIPVQVKAAETFQKVKKGITPLQSLKGGRRKTDLGGDLFSAGFAYGGTHYRAIARKTDDGDFQWLWIGTHEEYNNVIKRRGSL